MATCVGIVVTNYRNSGLCRFCGPGWAFNGAASDALLLFWVNMIM